MRFDRLAEQVTRHVVRPWFFAVTVGLILVWLPSLILWEAGPSDLLVDGLTNPLSLLLLVLLQNSQFRSERAKDEAKINSSGRSLSSFANLPEVRRTKTAVQNCSVQPSGLKRTRERREP